MDERQRIVIEQEDGFEIMGGIIVSILYLLVYIPLRLIWDLTIGRRR